MRVYSKWCCFIYFLFEDSIHTQVGIFKHTVFCGEIKLKSLILEFSFIYLHFKAGNRNIVEDERDAPCIQYPQFDSIKWSVILI